MAAKGCLFCFDGSHFYVIPKQYQMHQNWHFYTEYFTESAFDRILHNLTKPYLALPNLQPMSLPPAYIKPT